MENPWKIAGLPLNEMEMEMKGNIPIIGQSDTHTVYSTLDLSGPFIFLFVHKKEKQHKKEKEHKN